MVKWLNLPFNLLFNLLFDLRVNNGFIINHCTLGLIIVSDQSTTKWWLLILWLMRGALAL